MLQPALVSVFTGTKPAQLSDVLAEYRAFPRGKAVVFDDVLEVVDGFIEPAPVEPVTVQLAFEIREVADGVVVALRLPAAAFETGGAAKIVDGPVDQAAAVAVAALGGEKGGCKESCAEVASCDHGEIVLEPSRPGGAGCGAGAPPYLVAIRMLSRPQLSSVVPLPSNKLLEKFSASVSLVCANVKVR